MAHSWYNVRTLSNTKFMDLPAGPLHSINVGALCRRRERVCRSPVVCMVRPAYVFHPDRFSDPWHSRPWGVYRVAAEFFGFRLAALTAFVIAINPAFVNMTVFDNNAVGVAMAGLGLSGACLARYHQRRGFWAAFAFGLAMGFGVWGRANFVWVLIAGFVAGLIVFRRRLAIPAAHWLAVLLGGVVGGFPFLVFQIISGGATWKAREALSIATPMGALLRDRVFWFADMLISDGEHRQMWSGPVLPEWQLWFFPLLVIAACFVCLFSTPAEAPRRRSFARAVVITFFITGAFLLFSKLPVAEHHLIILLPFAAVIVVAACSVLETTFPGRGAHPSLCF